MYRRDNKTPENQRRRDQTREYNYMRRNPDCEIYRPHSVRCADSFGELWCGLQPNEESMTENSEQAIKFEPEIESKPVIKVEPTHEQTDWIEPTHRIESMDRTEPTDRIEPMDRIEPKVKSEPATTEALDTDDGMKSTFACVLVKTELKMDNDAADVDDEDTKDGVEDSQGPEDSGENSHIGSHIHVREFRCHLCEFSTDYRTALRSHVRAHNRPPKAAVVEKKFRCQQCDYVTAYHQALKIHIGGRHSTNKAFKCDVCEYCTRYATALRRHVLSKHSNPSECEREKKKTDHAKKKRREYIKKFKCTHCDYITAHRHALKSHLGMHSEDKPFRCVLCQYCTKYSTALRRHRQTMHVDNQTSVFESVASVETSEVGETESADYLISIEPKVSEDNDPLQINTKEIKIEIKKEQ